VAFVCCNGGFDSKRDLPGSPPRTRRLRPVSPTPPGGGDGRPACVPLQPTSHAANVQPPRERARSPAPARGCFVTACVTVREPAPSVLLRPSTSNRPTPPPTRDPRRGIALVCRTSSRSAVSAARLRSSVPRSRGGGGAAPAVATSTDARAEGSGDHPLQRPVGQRPSWDP
jgi:hypothetical protein